MPAFQHHTIWSHQPIALHDADLGVNYSAAQISQLGVIISWSDKTRLGHFIAHARVAAAIPQHYRFSLVSIGACDDDHIEGLFDVWRGNHRVVGAGVGKLYGLNQAAGGANYFKLYIGDNLCYAEKWHLGATINVRYDVH